LVELTELILTRDFAQFDVRTVAPHLRAMACTVFAHAFQALAMRLGASATEEDIDEADSGSGRRGI
jgi:hypothetical protein